MESAEDSASTFRREVEELHQALCKLFPDPVDVYEDALARELGICRPSGLSDDDWRRYRVRAIERRGGGSALAKARAAVEARRSLNSVR